MSLKPELCPEPQKATEIPQIYPKSLRIGFENMKSKLHDGRVAKNVKTFRNVD
jgi:hypothetical protein